jgi:hypothetical protein
MKTSSFHRVMMALSLVAMIAVWTTLPIVAADRQQRSDVNAKKSVVNPTATPDPSKPGTEEPQSSTPAQGSASGGGQLQPAKQVDDKSAASKPPGSGTPENSQVKQEGKEAATLPLLGYRYSKEAVGISVLMILVLGLLFVLQLYYSHRLDQTTYLGEVFRESVLNFESSRLEAQHRDKWAKGGYVQDAVNNEPPPPLESELEKLDEHFGDGQLRFLRERVFVGAIGLGVSQSPFDNSLTGGLGISLPGLPSKHQEPQDQPEGVSSMLSAKSYESMSDGFKRSLRDWQDRIKTTAYSTYQKDLKDDQTKAEANTKSAIDATEASLLRGQGPQFVLEFTALIVIIFLAVVLGVLGVLKEQQIGTLLAAIAGYVLGKATSPRATATQETAKGQT